MQNHLKTQAQAAASEAASVAWGSCGRRRCPRSRAASPPPPPPTPPPLGAIVGGVAGAVALVAVVVGGYFAYKKRVNQAPDAAPLRAQLWSAPPSIWGHFYGTIRLCSTHQRT
jgi:hypothetical protein